MVITLLSGCVGTETKYLHNEQFRVIDPNPEKYIEAYADDSRIYIHYVPKQNEWGRVKAVANSYWLIKPINTAQAWTIHRKETPLKDFAEEKSVPIKMVNLPCEKLPNPFMKIDYGKTIQEQRVQVPVIFLFPNAPSGYPYFLLVEENTNTGKYIYSKMPLGTSFLDKRKRALFIWLYPITMTMDFFFEPFVWEL
jgi:hypothetical protein